MMELPDGLTACPLVMADASAVAAVFAAQERVDLGEVFTEEADVVGDWQRPSFDLVRSTVGVFDGEVLVAYAEVSSSDRGEAAVRPDYRGRGIGTALARWMQDRARAGGAAVIGVPTPAGSAGAKLMSGLGYHVRWTSWVLRLPPGRQIVPQRVPAGYSVRQAAPRDYRDVHRVIDDAFLEWSTTERDSYEDFAAGVYERPGFEPWHVRVATAPGGAIVGAVWLTTDREYCFVAKLAVRAEHRHRGLARALLADAFVRARGHGATVCELSTDSRTGALGLYEKLGMVVTSTWLNYAVEL
jgi:ribosomal protein S18 acetylase RimI-like enzyme